MAGNRNPRQALVELAKFGAVGVVNTAIGFLTILAAMVLLGLAPVPANMLGYAVGLVVSYNLNRAFTFAGRGGGGRLRLPLFLIAFAVAYAVNVVVLMVLLPHVPPLLAQAGAMMTYTLVFFVLARTLVFRAG